MEIFAPAEFLLVSQLPPRHPASNPDACHPNPTMAQVVGLLMLGSIVNYFKRSTLAVARPAKRHDPATAGKQSAHP